MSSSRTPTLAEVLQTALETHTADLRVALPAKVLSYDSGKQSVDVQPALRMNAEQPDGSFVSERLPVINNVPVVFPGAGGFRITFPVQAGDTCLLVFADGSLDRWKHDGIEADETDGRRHNISDAVAVMGFNPFSSPWSGADTSNMTLGKDGGVQITCKAGEIDLAGNTDAVVKGTTYRMAEDALLTALDALLIAISNVPPVSTNAGVIAARPTYVAAKAAFDAASITYLSSIVKVA